METFYNTILHWIRKHTIREQILCYICKYLPYITAVSYIGMLIYTFFFSLDLLFPMLGIPLSIFTFVTIVRKIWNRARPYETLNMTPLFKNKKGESTPSRHTASAFAIALTSFLLHPYLGYFLITVAICIAISRIIAGVHYISDVLLAICIAFAFYNFWIRFL